MYSCDTCKKVYSTNFNLLKHTRNVHDQNIYLKTSNITCSQCNVTFKHMKGLRVHLAENHDSPTTTNVLNFSNFSDFKEWKRKEEIENCCRYVTVRGATHMANGQVKKEFVCHRSAGSEKSKKRNSFKNYKSYKLDCTCPASIETVINSDDTVDVVFYSTHTDHSKDVKSLRIGRKERVLLGMKLAKGYTFDEVLDEVKNSERSASISPKYYDITKKDLYNIKAYFGLHDIYELDETNGTFRTLSRGSRTHFDETVIERDVQKNHSLGLRINTDDITEIHGLLWDVKTYAVEMIRPFPCSCHVRCPVCQICIHMFKCDCYVSVTEKDTICSHIHAVVKYIGNDENVLVERFLKREKKYDNKIANIVETCQIESDDEDAMVIRIKHVDWDRCSNVDEEILCADDNVFSADQNSPYLVEYEEKTSKFLCLVPNLV